MGVSVGGPGRARAVVRTSGHDRQDAVETRPSTQVASERREPAQESTQTCHETFLITVSIRAPKAAVLAQDTCARDPVPGGQLPSDTSDEPRLSSQGEPVVPVPARGQACHTHASVAASDRLSMAAVATRFRVAESTPAFPSASIPR